MSDGPVMFHNDCHLWPRVTQTYSRALSEGDTCDGMCTDNLKNIQISLIMMYLL